CRPRQSSCGHLARWWLVVAVVEVQVPPGQIHVVHDHAQDGSAGHQQPIARLADQPARGAVPLHHEHHGVDLPREHHGIRHRQHGRRIDDQEVVSSLPVLAAPAEGGARVRLATVLPSAASALVTRTTLGGAPRAVKRTAVRRLRKASATCDHGSCTTTSSPRPSSLSVVPSPLLAAAPSPLLEASSRRAWRPRAVPRRAWSKLGMVASVGSRSSSSTSWGLLTLWSKYSQAKAAPTASTSPASAPRTRLSGTFGLLGRRG